MNSETTDSTRVYRETTISLPAAKQTPQVWQTLKNKNKNAIEMQKLQKKKKTRRDKSDLGDNFIAPDGGWAWLVCIAAGFSNLSLYPCLQMFGFIFRDRLIGLGLSSSQITAIINTNSAISSCTGLLNGPMFRRFSYRQVAMAGSFLIFSGLVLTAFCERFLTYIIFYSLLYGFGMGISVSASSLALNTYFKVKRRKAAGFSWTITGFGPIIFPYIITHLLPIYGVQATIMMFAAFSLHTVVSGLIYQPVKYHAITQNTLLEECEDNALGSHKLCKWCETQQQQKKTGIFSSQYLYQDDDEDKPGYEITSPGTPMLSRANDGWYGSKLSLTSNKMRFRTVDSSKDLHAKSSCAKPLPEEHDEIENYKPNHFNRERDENRSIQRSYSLGKFKRNFCTCDEMKTLQEQEQNDQKSSQNEDIMIEAKKMSIWEKITIFFDLDLLKDLSYVNLVIGLTIINFGELNFSILTPFILHDFGFVTSQITLAMSLLASLDISMRFLTPFLTKNISWDNRVFFLLAVTGIAIGRTVIACTRSYTLILVCFGWCGLCKGIRTVFWPLIIPGFVPLKRLPAATGLQLLITGLFGLVAGPLVGLICDKYNFEICLHFLNSLTFIADILWSVEALIHRCRNKSKAQTSQVEENLDT